MSTHHDTDDLAARAMTALEHDLVLPADLEARLLASIPLPLPFEDGEEVARARGNHRAPSSVVASKRPRSWVISTVSALGLAAVVVIAGGSWFSEHEKAEAALTRDRAAERAAVAVVAIDWNDGAGWREKMAALEELRRDISGPASREATARLAPRYVDGVRRAFLDAAKAHLEDELRAGTSDRAVMKAYLDLGDPEALPADGGFLADALTTNASVAIAAKTGRSVEALRPELRPHAVAWIFLVETKLAPAASLDPALADRARRALAEKPAP